MGAFGGLFITNVGRTLQAKAQTGVQLNFTRIAAGDGSLTGQAISDLTALISEKDSMSITKLKTQPGGQAVVGSVLSNSGIVTGFYFRELGVFAQDPDVGEILYCYGNAGANAEYIPAGGGPDIVEKHIDVVTLIGNATNVSATIDNSLVYATEADFEAHLNDKNNPHQVTSVQIGALPLSGGTITGVLTLHQDPVNSLEAATKEYVDSEVQVVQTIIANYDCAASSPDANGKYLVTTYTRVSDSSKYMVSTLSGTMDANGNYPTMTNVFYKADGATVDHTDTWTLSYDANGVRTNATVVTS